MDSQLDKRSFASSVSSERETFVKSKQPALIIFSTAAGCKRRLSMRRQKLSSEVNFPCTLSFTIASASFSPTFLIPTRPKDMIHSPASIFALL